MKFAVTPGNKTDRTPQTDVTRIAGAGAAAQHAPARVIRRAAPLQDVAGQIVDPIRTRCLRHVPHANQQGEGQLPGPFPRQGISPTEARGRQRPGKLCPTTALRGATCQPSGNTHRPPTQEPDPISHQSILTCCYSRSLPRIEKVNILCCPSVLRKRRIGACREPAWLCQFDVTQRNFRLPRTRERPGTPPSSYARTAFAPPKALCYSSLPKPTPAL